MKGKGISRIAAATLCGLAIGVVAYVAVQWESGKSETRVGTAEVPESSILPVDVDYPRGQTRPASKPASANDHAGARTSAGVAWLERNGYPTSQLVREALARGGRGAQLTFSGTPDAVAILDAEQIALNDPSRQDEALQTLAEHARAGSVYALETMARIHQDGANPDHVRARAFMKAAELRGNWAAGLAPLKAELTPQQRMHATLMAHQIIRNLSLSRERRRLPPLTIDTRPGLDELAMELEALDRARGN